MLPVPALVLHMSTVHRGAAADAHLGLAPESDVMSYLFSFSCIMN